MNVRQRANPSRAGKRGNARLRIGCPRTAVAAAMLFALLVAGRLGLAQSSSHGLRLDSLTITSGGGISITPRGAVTLAEPVTGCFASTHHGICLGIMHRVFPMNPPAGDMDGNGHVDLADYEEAHDRCFTDPCPQPPCEDPMYNDSRCRVMDFDEDGDVDLEDFAAFQQAITDG